MLESISHYAVRGFSVVVAAIVFVLTLPIVLAAMVLMVFAGMIALANVRSRLRTASAGGAQQSQTDPSVRTNSHKPPIEGSYTVLRD